MWFFRDCCFLCVFLHYPALLHENEKREGAFLIHPSSSAGTYAQHTHAAPHAALWRRVKEEHVKNAAHDGTVRVLILSIVISQRRFFLKHTIVAPG